ncbi:hypothetical protein CRUP_012307 [Coryphaenoides rupestris]|nr:hypothetical protein CRUP_012307 [Coryphaenoides rupestris]
MYQARSYIKRPGDSAPPPLARLHRGPLWSRRDVIEVPRANERPDGAPFGMVWVWVWVLVFPTHPPPGETPCMADKLPVTLIGHKGRRVCRSAPSPGGAGGVGRGGVAKGSGRREQSEQALGWLRGEEG